MNSRLYTFLVFVIVSLFLVFPYQSYAKTKRLKSSVSPAASNASTSSNEKAADKEPNVASAAPRIKFDKVVHDFCEVSPDSINSCVFNFTNVGLSTLEIARTQGTCKCTVPELEKKSYAPGESGQINVRYHAPTYQGPTSQSIFVFTNDPENPKMELTVQAHVQAQVQVVPDMMTLSLVDANNAGAVAVTLKSIDKEPFAVTEIFSEGNVFTVEFDPNKVSDTHTFYPKVNIENLRNYLNGYLNFTLNHPACKSVRAAYNCLREFEASPTVVIIRDAVVGQIQKRAIYLTSNYNQPIELETIVSDKGFVKVISQEKTANRFKIDIEIVPPPREGASRVFSDTLRIKIKDKEPIEVPCRGFYKANQ
jgi:hypothetical protein